MKHYEANPGMTYDKLIDWCYTKYEMKKRLSRAAVSLWFSEKAGKRQQKDKLKAALASETNVHKLQAKSFQGSHFPYLEHELFA